MNNLKTLMVALAAAMLAVNVAPMAAATHDDPDCAAFDNDKGSANIANGANQGNPGADERDLWTIDLTGTTEAKSVTFDVGSGTVVGEIYRVVDDETCVPVGSIPSALLPGAIYRAFVSNPTDDPQSYTMRVADLN